MMTTEGDKKLEDNSLGGHGFALEPVHKSAHLFGLDNEFVVMVSDPEGSLSGCCCIEEPVLLVSDGFLEEPDEVDGILVFVARKKVIAMSGEKSSDLVVHCCDGFLDTGLGNAGLDLVAVAPLLPCKVMELSEEALDPFAAGLADLVLTVVIVLQLAP